jgi:retinol dehydrogenase-12
MASTDVDVKFVELDLTCFDSIKAAARIVLAGATRLDILMLNAGIVRTDPFQFL